MNKALTSLRAELFQKRGDLDGFGLYLLVFVEYFIEYLSCSGTSILSSAKRLGKFVLCIEGLLYRGSVPYILKGRVGEYHQFVILTTSLYRGLLSLVVTLGRCGAFVLLKTV